MIINEQNSGKAASIRSRRTVQAHGMGGILCLGRRLSRAGVIEGDGEIILRRTMAAVEELEVSE